VSRRRIARGLAVAGLLLAATAVALAALVLATEPGARWTLARALPDGVAVDRIDGRLLGPLVLHGLESRSDGADLRVDRVSLAWRPSRLWRRTIRIDELNLQGVVVRQKPVEAAEPEPFDLDEIAFPFSVHLEVERLRLGDLRIWPVDAAEPVVVDEVLAAASGRGSEIRLHDLRVRAPTYRLDAAGEIVTRGGFPLDLHLAWQAALPDQPPLAGRGRLHGELLGRISVEHDLLEPTAARLTAQVDDALRDLRWCAELEVPRFALRVVRDDLEAYDGGVSLSACGDAEEAMVQGQFAALVAEIGEVAGELRIAYGEQRVRLEELAVRVPAGGRLRARGEVGLGGDAPAFRIVGEWADLGWPLAGAAEYASPRGRFEVDGTAARYRVAAAADVAGSAAPAGRWRVEGRGTPTELVLERIVGVTLDGSIRAGGRVAWGEQVGWSLRATADRLDPGAFLPDLPGRLGLEIATSGTMRHGRLQADVRLGRLDGELLGVPVALRSSISLDGDRYRIRDLELRSGSARLRAAGEVGARWALRWEAEAPELAEFAERVEGLRGSLTASGTVAGAPERPRIDVALLADSVGMAEHAAGSVAGSLALDLADREPSSLRLVVSGIRSGDAILDRLELSGGGTHGDHALTLVAAAPADSLVATLTGGVAGDGWNGSLDQLDLRTARFGEWALREPAPIRAGADSARLEGLCWGSGDAEACLAGEWSAVAGGRGSLEVQRVPLDLLQPFLPDDATLDGELNLAGQADLDPAGSLRAEARLGAGPGALRFGPPGEGQPRRAFERLGADLRIDDVEMRAGFALRLADGDSVVGSFAVPQHLPADVRPITGRITGEIHDRGLLGLLIDDVGDTDGVLRLDLSPHGTLAAPALAGRVTVSDARADLLPLGLRLRAVTLEASSDGGPAWSLNGGAASGEGRVELVGSLRLPDAEEGAETPPWSADLAVSGERFEAINTPLARVIASPRLQLRAGPERIDLAGEVRVPWARITPAEFEAVVPASEDVVIVGPDGEPAAEPEPAVAIHSRVRVLLGDSVQLDAFGLRGRLAGSLEVADAPGSVTTGRGEVQIVEGTFERFRQRLAIDRGRLIFADGPVDNPGLDMRITRRTRDVLAGMNVGGTAAAPRIEFFSEPGMAEADVLAYLLLGRPATLASQAEGEFLQNAAASAGLAGGRMLAGRLGSTLGLQDARIEGEELQQASLFLGTYLSPRLYVGYGFGLFDAANLLRIRYQLGRSWVLQTESGAETGADLLFTVER
jgi:translocation and assembly module TamB